MIQSFQEMKPRCQDPARVDTFMRNLPLENCLFDFLGHGPSPPLHPLWKSVKVYEPGDALLRALKLPSGGTFPTSREGLSSCSGDCPQTLL